MLEKRVAGSWIEISSEVINTKTLPITNPTSTFKGKMTFLDTDTEVLICSIFVDEGTSLTGRLVSYDNTGADKIILEDNIECLEGETTIVSEFTENNIENGRWLAWENISVSGAVKYVYITVKYK